jgi:hypothetical protein
VGCRVGRGTREEKKREGHFHLFSEGSIKGSMNGCAGSNSDVHITAPKKKLSRGRPRKINRVEEGQR